MAVSKSDLTIKVVLDTKGTESGLVQLKGGITSLEKAMSKSQGEVTRAEKSIMEIGQAAALTVPPVGELSKVTITLANSARDFNQEQLNTRSSFDIAAQSVSTMAVSVTALHSAYSLMTNNESISRISKLLRVSALLADLKGYDSIAEKMRGASDKVLEFGVSNDAAGRKVDEAIEKYADLDRTIEGTKDAFGGLAIVSAAVASAPFIPAIIAQTKAAGDLGKAVFSAGASFKSVQSEAATFMSTFNNFKVAAERAANGIQQSAKSAKDFASVIGKDFSALGSDLRKVGEIAKNVGKAGFLSLAETSSIAGAAVGGLGTVLLTFESTSAKVVGAILVVAAAITGAFGFAVNMALGFIGKLAVSMGDVLINSMKSFEEKALKLQVVMSQFVFTVKGFNKVYGEEAVGSLDKWQKALDNTVKTTMFTSEETAKAIKLMVAEGKTLGLSVVQTTTLFEKAKDIAAATGNSLDDVVNRLISGLAGNSQAVLALGINTSETALNQLELVQATGKVVSSLSSQDQIMARLAEVFIATKPLAGAAAFAVNSVSGAYAMLDKQVNAVKARIGEQGQITQAYLMVLANLATALLNLPPAVFGFIGSLQDVLGVTLKVVGTILQYTLTIVGLSTAYTLLTGAIAKYTIVQTVMTSSMGLVGSALGVQTLAVTSLKIVFVNLGLILKGSVVTALAAAGTAVSGLVTGLVTVSAVVAPFIFVALKAVVVLMALYEGFKVVDRETKIFSDTGKHIANVFNSIFSSAKSAVGPIVTFSHVIKQLSNLLVASGAMVVSAFVSVIQRVAFVIFKAGEAITFFSKTLSDILGDAANSASEKVKSLSMVTARSLGVIVSLGASSALAGDNIGNIGDNAEAAGIKLKGLADASEKMTELQRTLLIPQSLGDNESVMAVQKQIILMKMSTVAEGKEREELVTEFLKNQLNIQKAFSDGVQSADKAALETRKRILESSKDSGAVNKLIEIRKTLEGQDLKTQIIRLSVLADESGANEAIAKLKNQLKELNQSIEREEKGKAFQLYVKTFDEITKGVKETTDALTKLKQVGADLEISFSMPNQSEAEKQYQTVLNSVSAEQSKLESLGASRKQIDSITASLVIQAQSNKQLQEGAKIIADIFADQEKSLEQSKKLTDELYEANKKASQDLLRSGMSLSQIRAFELQIEHDKLDALKNQFDESTKIGKEGLAQIETAKKLASSKSETSQGASNLTDIAGSGFADVISKIFPEIMSEFANEMMTTIAEAANIITLVLKAPDLIKGLASFIDSLTQFPIALMDAMVTLVSSFGKFLGTFVTNMAKAIPSIIDSLITLIVTQAPQLMGVLIEAALQAVTSIIEKLPDIALAFVEYILLNSAKISLSLIKGLISGVPKLISALAKAIPAIIPAILNGIRDAIFGLGDAFADMFGDSISGGLNKAGESFKALGTGVSNQLFAVADFAAQTAAGTKAEQYAEAIRNGARDAVSWIRKLWDALAGVVSRAWEWVQKNILDPLVGVVQRAFQWVIDNILTPIATFVSDAFQWVIDNILTPIATFVSDAFQWVIDNVLEPLSKFVSDAFQWIIDNVWKPLAGVVSEAFKAVIDFLSKVGATIWAEFIKPVADWFGDRGRAIWQGLKDGFGTAGDFFTKIGTQIWDGFKGILGSIGNAFSKIISIDASGAVDAIKKAFSGVFDTLKDIFKGLFNPIIDALNGIKLPKFEFKAPNWAGGGKVTFWNEIDLIPGTIPRFAQGGFVPGQSNSDTQPAMLTPGEFVMSRRGVSAIGADALQSMNRGQSPMGSNVSNVSVNLTLNTSEKIDANYVRDKLMPSIKEELRKESRRGGYIIAAAGVRS